jgi:hypothetical protein
MRGDRIAALSISHARIDWNGAPLRDAAPFCVRGVTAGDAGPARTAIGLLLLLSGP